MSKNLEGMETCCHCQVHTYLLAQSAGVATCTHSRHFDSTCATRSNAFNSSRSEDFVMDNNHNKHSSIWNWRTCNCLL